MWFKTRGLKHIRFYHNKPYKSNTLVKFYVKNKKLYQIDITPVPTPITNIANRYSAMNKIINHNVSLM